MTMPVAATLTAPWGRTTVTSPAVCDVGAVTVLIRIPGVDAVGVGVPALAVAVEDAPWDAAGVEVVSAPAATVVEGVATVDVDDVSEEPCEATVAGVVAAEAGVVVETAEGSVVAAPATVVAVAVAGAEAESGATALATAVLV
jgi:hypothetical protein